jgi:hypothetical protein
MTITIFPNDALQIAQPQWDFSTAFEPTEVIISPVGNPSFTDMDSTYSTSGVEIVDHDAVLQLTEISATPMITAANLTPDIVQFNNDSGRLTRIADGRARFRISAPGTERIVSFPVVRQGAQSIAFSNFVTGSLARACSDAVAALIDGKTPGTSTQNIFSSADFSTPAFTRNTNLFTGSLNLTCIPAAHITNDVIRPYIVGCLVAPDILISANHAPYDNTHYFVTNDNVVISRDVSAAQQVGDTDIRVQKLSSSLPNTISYVKVLPANYADYLPHYENGIPLVWRNQLNQMMLAQTAFVPGHATIPTGDFSSWYTPADGSAVSPSQVAVVNDSGSPVFAIINNEPVLLWTWHIPTEGPFIANYISEINDIIDSLGSSSTLTTIDLDFPTYS